MVTHHQRAVLLNLTQQLAALMSECGVMNLEYHTDEMEKSNILMASLTRTWPGQNSLRLSAPGWCELSTLPLAITAPPSSQDSTSGSSGNWSEVERPDKPYSANG